ncbi:MAG: hypothetical protein AABX59_04145 [Nanoarchaeota archaeon]
MPNMTLSIPEELHKRMKRHNEIKWSSLVRNIIKERLEDLERAERIASKSKFTESDAFEISEKIKGATWRKIRRHMKRGE